MAKPTETYSKHVALIEEDLAAYAKHSFEPECQVFVDGASIHETFDYLWQSEPSQLRLRNRTPLQLERDRILYSTGLRKQTDKYHVLYNGQRRILRNYTTHTMRMAQVTRSICRALSLNTDFAEAISYGSKIGATPFIHAAKQPTAIWAANKILEIDKSDRFEPLRAGAAKAVQQDLFTQDLKVNLPSWIDKIKSKPVLQKVQQYMPWAIGVDIEAAYSAGQEGYWLLCTNPYTREATRSSYSPDTMYGIWRHTRGLLPGPDTFHHRAPVEKATTGFHEIKGDHVTYEATVVQYADDITWIIENLSDANDAALLNGQGSLYEELRKVIGEEIPEGLLRPLAARKSGGIYTYFIDDFVRQSRSVIEALDDEGKDRAGLKAGDMNSLIGLSPEADVHLGKIEKFLHDHVFEEPRVKNRKIMLEIISKACLELLYNGEEDVLPRLIKERSMLDGWERETLDRANELLRDPIHRVQLAIDIFANMGDQEIYDFVGIQSL